jgi:hypothetical protein
MTIEPFLIALALSGSPEVASMHRQPLPDLLVFAAAREKTRAQARTAPRRRPPGGQGYRQYPPEGLDLRYVPPGYESPYFGPGPDFQYYDLWDRY